jgi:hypothetical protein
MSDPASSAGVPSVTIGVAEKLRDPAIAARIARVWLICRKEAEIFAG